MWCRLQSTLDFLHTGKTVEASILFSEYITEQKFAKWYRSTMYVYGFPAVSLTFSVYLSLNQENYRSTQHFYVSFP